MTSADPEEVVTATSEGITVEKSFEPDDFPVPAIAFVVSSDRNEAVSIRLVDAVPEDVAPENIGFHPKYGAEFWDVDGDSIVFEREIAPNEEYTTVYGLRGSDPDIAAKFMGAPRLESVDPPLEDDTVEATDEADDDDGPIETGDDDLSASKAESPETSVGSSLEEATTTEEIVNTEDALKDDSSEDALTNERPESDLKEERSEENTTDETPMQSPETPDPSPDSNGRLLDELAGEIRAAESDDPELIAVRDALGLDPVRASVETRIEHLQSSIADLEAYADALEAFLDENGDAQQLIDDVRTEYEETTERLDDVEALAEDATESVSTVEERFEAEIEDLDSEIEALESDLDAISSELSDVTEMRNRLASALGGLAEEPTGDAGDN